MVQTEETVMLVKALQRCADHFGMPLGMLLGAVEELHECLPSVIQSGDLVDFKILDVVEKDPVTLSLHGEHHHQCPWWNHWLV